MRKLTIQFTIPPEYGHMTDQQLSDMLVGEYHSALFKKKRVGICPSEQEDTKRRARAEYHERVPGNPEE